MTLFRRRLGGVSCSAVALLVEGDEEDVALTAKGKKKSKKGGAK